MPVLPSGGIVDAHLRSPCKVDVVRTSVSSKVQTNRSVIERSLGVGCQSKLEASSCKLSSL